MQQCRRFLVPTSPAARAGQRQEYPDTETSGQIYFHQNDFS